MRLSIESLNELRRLSELTGLPLSTLVNYSVLLLRNNDNLKRLEEAYASVLRAEREFAAATNPNNVS